MPRDPSTDREARREHRRSAHHRQRSATNHDRDRDRETDAEREERRRKRRSQSKRPTSTPRGGGGGNESDAPLSAAALAQLNKANAKEKAKSRSRPTSRQPPERTERRRSRAPPPEPEPAIKDARDLALEWERSRGKGRFAPPEDQEDAEREARRAARRAARERERTRERSRAAGYESVGQGYESGGIERERKRGRSKGYERIDGGGGGLAPKVITVAGPSGERYERDRAKGGRRVVSGAQLEEGIENVRDRKPHRSGLRGGGFMGFGGSSEDSMLRAKPQETESDLWRGKPRPWYKQKKKLWILIGVCTVLLIIIIIVAAVVVPNAGKGEDKRDDGSGGNSGSSNLGSISPDSIPKDAPSWLNPFVWASTDDFNLTYTTETVGDLPVMGLYTSWDDSARANDKVPALDKPWGDYSKRPARGVNVGGWLSLEPFITPSLFDYDSRYGIVDEYTLCKYLASRCESVLEKHYASFVTESTFRDIAAAGLDHVRIPFSYWAVQTYDGDPYLFRTSWRYLLRAIEWCRKYGLRVNLDPHGLPGSQNGWNHSGRLGAINWLNGTDGDLNAQRSLDFHDRISKFFAQPRYRNVISHYGLANEPKMTELSVPAVLDWTTQVSNLVRKNGIPDSVVIVFGDGFRGLHNWQGELQSLENAALDVHQYVIFNEEQIVYNHSQKIKFACQGWTEQTLQSMDRSTGFGPTLVAEWSQADTDCARHLTNVGWGNRWTGTLGPGGQRPKELRPRCPAQDRTCSCEEANAQPDRWSDGYKRFLKMFAEAQMSSFEKGWGWFYWVWDTEDA
ncbi:glycoside hydrolase superfamily [Apiosordaria backusii]|uniref:glucan 1,3-beta-glucosidase n=1 Tax=Apiosordaria backusii TaxID=314023 RepID=A0AA40END1_9PEZI|nr:glycoside hydrolase superfamily [Apiosordaria backusii]